MSDNLIALFNNSTKPFAFADQIVTLEGNLLFLSAYTHKSSIANFKDSKRREEMSNNFEARTSSSNLIFSKYNTFSKYTSVVKTTRLANQEIFHVVKSTKKVLFDDNEYNAAHYVLYMKLSPIIKYFREKIPLLDEYIAMILRNPNAQFKNCLLENPSIRAEIFKCIKNYTKLPFLEEWVSYALVSGDGLAIDTPYAMYSDINDENNIYAFRIKIKENSLRYCISRALNSKYISINGCNTVSEKTRNIDNLTEYLDIYSDQLINKARNKFSARFNPETDEFSQKEKDYFEYAEYFGKMKLFNAQKNVIASVNRCLDHNRSAFIVGEMGVGKTSLAIASIFCNSKSARTNNIVMAPGHLVSKWKREIERLFPAAKVKIISDFEDVLNVEQELTCSLRNYPLFLIISKDTAKINYQERPAAIFDNKYKTFRCPHCGRSLYLRSRSCYAELNPNKYLKKNLDQSKIKNIEACISVFDASNSIKTFLSKNANNNLCIASQYPYHSRIINKKENSVYSGCNGSLWTATNSKENSKWVKIPSLGWVNKDAIAYFKEWYNTEATQFMKEKPDIKKYYNAIVNIEENGYPQTIAPRRYSIARYIRERFANQIDYFVADEVHLYSSGESAQANAFGDFVRASKKTIALTGTLLNGYADGIYYVLYRLYSKEFKKYRYRFDSSLEFVREYGVTKRTETYSIRNNQYNAFAVREIRRSEKVAPGVSPELFCRFLLDKAVFVSLSDMSTDLPSYTETSIAVEMDAKTSLEYNKAASKLKTLLQESNNDARDFAFLAIQRLNLYPDQPYYTAPIYDLNSGHKLLDFPDAISKPEEFISNKDLKTLEIVKEKIAKGENVLIYVSYVNKIDAVDRLLKMFEVANIKSAALTASVKAADREKWIDAQVKNGCRVLICNPTLVETGLDLLAFTNIIFYQVGYNLFTMRQAARRSLRLNQVNPVNVYFLYYKNTLQESVLSLMANKLIASMALEGKFSSDEGLSAMANNDNILTAVAESLVKNIEHKIADGIFTSGIGKAEKEDGSRFKLINMINEKQKVYTYNLFVLPKKPKQVRLSEMCG